MASEVYPMVEISDYPERFVPKGNEAEALRETAKQRIRARLLVLEENVAGPWLLTTGFCAADIYIAMFTRWRNSLVRNGWRAAHLPKIMALAEAVSQRPKIAPVWKRHFPKGRTRLSAQASSSATPFSARKGASSSPSIHLACRMSQPPTNSPFT